MVVSILLRTAMTIYFVPYTAMGAELSTDYDQRTIIAKARITVGWIAGMALPAIAYAFFLNLKTASMAVYWQITIGALVFCQQWLPE